MQKGNKGIRRYTRPVFFPVYGILAGYILAHIIKLTTGIIPWQYFLFTLAGHGFTLADILIITGALIGMFVWFRKSRQKNEKDQSTNGND